MISIMTTNMFSSTKKTIDMRLICTLERARSDEPANHNILEMMESSHVCCGMIWPIPAV